VNSIALARDHASLLTLYWTGVKVKDLFSHFNTVDRNVS